MLSLVRASSSLAGLELLEVVRARVHVVGCQSREKAERKGSVIASQHNEEVDGRRKGKRILTALKALDEVLALLLTAGADVLLLVGVTLVVRLRRGLLGLLGGCRAASTEQHVGETVANSRTDGDTGSGGSHLAKKTGALRLLRHGRRVLGVSLGRWLVVLLRRSGHGVGATRA